MTQPDHDREAFDEDAALRERLRAADPGSSLPPADPTGLARLLEDTMDHETRTPGTGTRASGGRDRTRLTWLVAAAAASVIGGVALVAAVGGDDPASVPSAGSSPDAPTTAPTSGATTEPAGAEPGSVTVLAAAPAAGSGRCAVPTPEILAAMPLAVEATVTGIAGDQVTLAPTEFFSGEETATLVVEQVTPEAVTLAGVPDFQVGETYLVSASEGQVSVCGFSGPAAPELQQLYAEAFRR